MAIFATQWATIVVKMQLNSDCQIKGIKININIWVLINRAQNKTKYSFIAHFIKRKQKMFFINKYARNEFEIVCKQFEMLFNFYLLYTNIFKLE